MASLLPPSIQDERFLLLEQLINRLAEIDLAILHVYDIDQVPAAALYFLAAQFNVLGYRGWLLCESEEEQRVLVGKAIALHRYAGTAWAITEALKAVGYGGAEVTENPPFRPDGTIYSDGSDYADGILAGGFDVDLNLGQKAFTPEREELVLRLIDEWKNARSQLLRLNAYQPLYSKPYEPPFLADGAFISNGVYLRLQ